MARGADYNEKIHPAIALAKARAGASMQAIAKDIGISKSTLYEWQATYAAFSDALEEGRAYANSLVVNALFKRCTGYEVEETTVLAGKKHANAKEEFPIKIERKKTHIAPETKAIMFWLQNKMSDEWKHVNHFRLGGDKDAPPIEVKQTIESDLSGLTDEELRALVALTAKIEATEPTE